MTNQTNSCIVYLISEGKDKFSSNLAPKYKSSYEQFLQSSTINIAGNSNKMGFIPWYCEFRSFNQPNIKCIL